MKQKAFSLIEILTVIAIVAALFTILPALVPTFVKENSSESYLLQFVQRGRAEALNCANPVILACAMESAEADYTLRWELYEAAEPTPRKIDTLTLDKTHALDPSKSKANGGTNTLELRNLGGQIFAVWQFPHNGTTPSAGGVLAIGEKRFIFNALGNLVEEK